VRKGEFRREKILDAAEKLFWEKGYDDTSIQDILNALDLSKGGFYHHFESKESVLAEVCEARCRENCEKKGLEIRLMRGSAVEKLNRVLSLANVFEREEPRLAAMMTRVVGVRRDVNLRERIRGGMVEKLAPVLTHILEDGAEDDLFTLSRPEETAKLILLLSHDAVEEVMRILSESPDDPEALVRAMDVLDAARDGIERMIAAPYGSVRIAELDRLIASLHEAEAALAKG